MELINHKKGNKKHHQTIHSPFWEQRKSTAQNNNIVKECRLAEQEKNTRTMDLDKYRNQIKKRKKNPSPQESWERPKPAS